MKKYIPHVLPACVHRTVVKAFNDTLLLKLVRPGQWLEFETQGH
jgi:hypothetical protein